MACERLARRGLVLVIAALLGAALPSACSGNVACIRNTDCKSGERCSVGVCVIEQTSSPSNNGAVDGSSVKDSSPSADSGG